MATAFVFPVDEYIERIRLSRWPRPNEAGLRALHRAQFFTIPFENLDIQLGRSIPLGPEMLIDKLIQRPRGGYCFELNGLMGLALEAFGFECRPLLARVHLESPPSGRTHQVNLVNLDGRPWVMDVGFGGGGPRAPLRLEDGAVEEDAGFSYRIVSREPWGFMMQTREGGTWKDSYSLDMSLATPADIRVGNHFTSTSPDSPFTRARIVSLPVSRGRISLRDFTLTEISDGVVSTSVVAPGIAYMRTLKDRFGLQLNAAYEDLKEITCG